MNETIMIITVMVGLTLIVIGLLAKSFRKKPDLGFPIKIELEIIDTANSKIIKGQEKYLLLEADCFTIRGAWWANEYETYVDEDTETQIEAKTPKEVYRSFIVKRATGMRRLCINIWHDGKLGGSGKEKNASNQMVECR